MIRVAARRVSTAAACGWNRGTARFWVGSGATPDHRVLCRGTGGATGRLGCWTFLFIGLLNGAAGAQPLDLPANSIFLSAHSKNVDSRAESGSENAGPVATRPPSVVLGAASVKMPSLRGSRISEAARRVAVWGEPADPAAGRPLDIWDTVNGQHRLRLLGHDHPIQDVLFFPDKHRLVSAAFRDSDAGGSVICWDLMDGKSLWRVPHGGVDLSRDGSAHRLRVLVGDQVRVLRLDNGAEVGRFVGGPTVGLHLSDRDRLWLGLNQKRDARIRLFDYTRQTEVHRFELVSGRPRAVVISQDNQTVAAAAGNVIVMWEVLTGKELGRLTGHERNVLALAFSPDGRFLASGGLGGMLRVWDVSACAPIRSFDAHTRAVTCLSFAASGRQMVSGGLDRLARIWQVAGLLKSSIPELDESAAGLEAVWQALASARPNQAYPAMDQAAASDKAVAQMLKMLKVDLLVSGNQRARQLVEKLADPDFVVRFRATESLKRMLPSIRPLLLKLLDTAERDEVRYRIRRILRGTQGASRYSAADVRRIGRVIQLMRRIPGPAATELLTLIAEQFPDDRIVAQARAALAAAPRQ